MHPAVKQAVHTAIRAHAWRPLVPTTLNGIEYLTRSVVNDLVTERRVRTRAKLDAVLAESFFQDRQLRVTLTSRDPALDGIIWVSML